MKLKIIENRNSIEEAYANIGKTLEKIRKKIETLLKSRGFTGDVSIRRTGVNQIFYLKISENGIVNEYRLGTFVVKDKEVKHRKEISFSSISNNGEQYAFYQLRNRGFLILLNGIIPVKYSDIPELVEQYLSNTLNDTYKIYEISRLFTNECRVSVHKMYSDDLADINSIDFDTLNKVLNSIQSDFNIKGPTLRI
jgi:hypothetical protein